MNASRLIERAAAAIRSGDRAAAPRLLANALAGEPNHAGVLMASAKMAQADADYPLAHALLNRLLAVEATDVAALIMRGQVEYAMGDCDGALSTFRQARGLADDDDALAYNIGVLLYARAEYAAAAESYSEALRINPGNDPAQRNRIMSLAGSGDIEATLITCGSFLARRRGASWSDTMAPNAMPALAEKEIQTSRYKLDHGQRDV